MNRRLSAISFESADVETNTATIAVSSAIAPVATESITLILSGALKAGVNGVEARTTAPKRIGIMKALLLIASRNVISAIAAIRLIEVMLRNDFKKEILQPAPWMARGEDFLAFIFHIF